MSIFVKRKNVIIGAAIFIVAIAATIGALVILKPSGLNPALQLEPAARIVSATTQACSVLDQAAITQQLGGRVETVQSGRDAGTATLPSGETISVCLYPFTEPANDADAAELISNGLSVEIYSHTSADSVMQFKNTRATLGKDAGQASAQGDTIFYTVPFSDGSVRYELIVYHGLTHHAFRIAQPKGDSVISGQDAERLLKTLVQPLLFQ